MGQVLHGSATTTEAVRRAIQLRQESVRALAKRYGVSPTTVQKWRKRSTTTDVRMGPKEPRSTVLTRRAASADPSHRSAQPALGPCHQQPLPKTTGGGFVWRASRPPPSAEDPRPNSPSEASPQQAWRESSPRHGITSNQ